MFATPDSSNFYYQSEYGFPTLTGRKVTTEEFRDQVPYQGKGYTIGIGGLAEPFAYYYHYPKPAYFNDMTDEEWQYSLARRFSSSNAIQPTPDDIEDYRYFFQNKFCRRYNFNPKPWQPVNDTPGNFRSTDQYPPCDIRCHLFSLGANKDYNTKAQLSTESDQPYNYYPDSEFDGLPVGPFGYNPIQRIEPDAPIWTQVAAGHYHTMALSSDNNLKIWGSYLYVDTVGNPLEDPNSIGSPGSSYFYKWTAVPTFLPEGEIWQDQWTLSGWTTGCGFCGGVGGGGLKQYHSGNPDDIVESDYMVATEANKTVFATREIMQIDGGPDYSIMFRKCRAGDTDTGLTGYKFVVWGNMEMVSSLTGPPGTVTITTNSGGLTGVGTKWYPFIDKVTAGPNSYGVIYKNKGGASRKVEIFERPGVNIGVKNIPEDISISDIAFSNTTAGGLYSAGIKANTWQDNSFDDNTHKKMQFNGFAGLPLWFRTHAFFSAVPGTWDFSKWIFGGPCNFISSDVGNDTQVDNIDDCSIYKYKDTNFGLNLSYSGIPQYYWMRQSWRRESPVVPVFSYEPKVGAGCGLLTDRFGRDGLRPLAEGGSGVIGDDLNSPTAVANRALNNFFGACFGGDICWVGDGSFSPYNYTRVSPESGGINVPCNLSTCRCWDKTCGCPPNCTVPFVPNCTPNQPATVCFKDIRCRIGFATNKDYFIQSCKTFGTVQPSGTVHSGRCCGVVETNITAFLYAKRSYYFGYDQETKTFKVKNTTKQYRAIGKGLKDRTREEMTFLDGEQINSTNSADFVIATQIETDAVSIGNFLIDNIIPYPPVYVGGGNLLPLEKDIEFSTNTIEYCELCSCGKSGPNGEPCLDPASKCSVQPEKLVGPGGWVHSRSSTPSQGQEYNGVVNSSVFYAYKPLPTELLPTTFDALGPLLNVGQFNGPVPDGMSGCSFWRDVSGAETPCGCDRTVYPEGRCPNGAVSCTGCIWRPMLGPFGGVDIRDQVFSIYGATGIDVLDAYFDGNTFLPDIPVAIPSGEDEDDEGSLPEVSVATELGNRLFRVYEKIVSFYSADGCEYYGDPPAFIGFTDQIFDQTGNDVSLRPGAFRATCNDGEVIGECMNIRCDDVDPIV